MSVATMVQRPGELAQVDWRRLSILLDFGADPVTQAAAAWHAERASSLLGPVHTRFVVRAVMVGESILCQEVAGCGGGAPVGRWLTRAVRAAFRLSANSEMPALPTLVIPGPPRPVHVDMTLRSLPCLGLAVEHAEQTRPLVVRAIECPPGADGRTWRAPMPARYMAYGQVTDVDAVQLVDVDPSAADVAGVWLHELGHVLNPSTPGRTPETDEDQADALALLLRHHRPATLEQLHALTGTQASAPEVRHALTDFADQDEQPGDLPAPGIESLLALANLKIA